MPGGSSWRRSGAGGCSSRSASRAAVATGPASGSGGRRGRTRQAAELRRCALGCRPASARRTESSMPPTLTTPARTSCLGRRPRGRTRRTPFGSAATAGSPCACSRGWVCRAWRRCRATRRSRSCLRGRAGADLAPPPSWRRAASATASARRARRGAAAPHTEASTDPSKSASPRLPWWRASLASPSRSAATRRPTRARTAGPRPSSAACCSATGRAATCGRRRWRRGASRLQGGRAERATARQTTPRASPRRES
mmetsp:Transcript_35245/g.113611  ORF Transcript_35245/g.113611 Transcript_35245/m.113611 type:complete len:255 (+) Transcript_35245:287-1051(+)